MQLSLSNSDQFQVLVFDDNFNSSEQIKQNQPPHHQSKPVLINNKNIGHQQISVGLLIEEQTYIILQSIDRGNLCDPSEWKAFILRKQKQLAKNLEKQLNQPQTVKQSTFRLSYRERNTILKLQHQNIEKRKQLWSIANYSEFVEQDFKQMQEFEQQNHEQVVIQLQNEIPLKQLQALNKGVSKISKILKNIIKINLQGTNHNDLSPSWISHLNQLKKSELVLTEWIRSILQRCAADFKEIRYCKGLQYLCLGIIISYPQINLAKYTQLFHHFLKHNQFWQLYLEGSPRFYCQLNKISQCLRDQNPLIYDQINQSRGDLKNIFVTYFRSCLLYRLTQPELIRKIFQILFVAGIPIIRTIILQIVSKMEPQLLASEHFLENLASFLVLQYFDDNSSDSKHITQKFQDLFQL